MGFGQFVEVVLQGELVEVLQSDILERVDQVCLDEIFLTLAVSSLQSASFSGR